jgi:hypothetical protein
VKDNSAVSLGKNSENNTSLPFVWNVATMPRGVYLITIEGYRQGLKLHYAVHQISIFINR